MTSFQNKQALFSLWIFGGVFFALIAFLVVAGFVRGEENSLLISNEGNDTSILQDLTEEALVFPTIEQTNLAEVYDTSEIERIDLQQGSCPTGTSNFDYTLFHVNSTISLGSYIPPNLVEIPSTIETLYPSLCIQYHVAIELMRVNDALKKAGHRLIVTSGFRDPKIQDMLHTRAQKNSHDLILASVAPPQHSEHQLGTTIDITSYEQGAYVQRKNFENSETYAWLSKHAHEYGFIQSYREGDEAITGYIAEPWHFRYVGPRIAIDIQNLGISLDEYLAQDLFLEK